MQDWMQQRCIYNPVLTMCVLVFRVDVRLNRLTLVFVEILKKRKERGVPCAQGILKFCCAYSNSVCLSVCLCFSSYLLTWTRSAVAHVFGSC